MTPELELQIRNIIKEELFVFLKLGNELVFEQNVKLLNGRNIQVGTVTGSKIGTSTLQKIGFYDVAPIVQRSGSAQAAVSGTADSTYSANEVTLINDLTTLINELRAALVAIGIIKGSA